MKTKIAVITTGFLKDFILSVFEEMNLDVEIRLFFYNTYRDIETLYPSIPPDYEGILTSGIFPAALIRKHFPDTDRCISYFNTDDAAICRLFLKLFLEEEALDFSRIYGDFVQVFGIGLREYLTTDLKSSLTDLVDPKVMAMTAEEICLLEEAQLRRHLELHRQGQIDFSVTRFSSIVPALLEHGCKVLFPFPSKSFVCSVTEKLLLDIDMHHMDDNRPAVINIAIQNLDSPDTGLLLPSAASFQLQCSALQDALLSFQGSSHLDYILQPTHTGFELLTNKKSCQK